MGVSNPASDQRERRYTNRAEARNGIQRPNVGADIFGTYETVEDVVLTMEALDYSGVPGSEINSPPEHGAPIFTTGKARIIIEPYNPAEGN